MNFVNKDNVDTILNMLGVSPREEFEIGGRKYCIDEDLKLRNCNDGMYAEVSNFYLYHDILSGREPITKIIKPTKRDQVAIDYARECGCNWLATDENGDVHAFRDKPIRDSGEWFAQLINGSNRGSIRIHMPISFLTWAQEPFCLNKDGLNKTDR